MCKTVSLLTKNLVYPAIQISDPINPRRELLAIPAKIVSPLTKNWRHWQEELEDNPSEVPQGVGRQWACEKPLNLPVSERSYFEVAGT